MTQALKQWADSHQTAEEVAEAIDGLARGIPEDAERIWQEPSREEWLAIWERVTGNGLRDGDDFPWGASRLGNRYPGDPVPDAHLREILGELATEIPKWQTVPVDDGALRQAVEAVEENNRNNDARWGDWGGFQDVEDVYGVTLCDVGRAIITRAIATDGVSLEEDLPAVERTVWGQNFAGSFWNRVGAADPRADQR